MKLLKYIKIEINVMVHKSVYQVMQKNKNKNISDKTDLNYYRENESPKSGEDDQELYNIEDINIE